ncbi:MAG: hypothetical protein WBA39_25400 [Rivularia sp. (in: cyanobacteria)]
MPRRNDKAMTKHNQPRLFAPTDLIKTFVVRASCPLEKQIDPKQKHPLLESKIQNPCIQNRRGDAVRGKAARLTKTS